MWPRSKRQLRASFRIINPAPLPVSVTPSRRTTSNVVQPRFNGIDNIISESKEEQRIINDSTRKTHAAHDERWANLERKLHILETATFVEKLESSDFNRAVDLTQWKVQTARPVTKSVVREFFTSLSSRANLDDVLFVVEGPTEARKLSLLMAPRAVAPGLAQSRIEAHTRVPRAGGSWPAQYVKRYL